MELSCLWRFTDVTSDRIDELFLNNSTPENAYRLETFRSTGSISATASQQLRCYFVNKCHFPPKPAVVPGQKTDIRSVSDSSFLDRATKNTLEIYQNVRLYYTPSVSDL